MYTKPRTFHATDVPIPLPSKDITLRELDSGNIYTWLNQDTRAQQLPMHTLPPLRLHHPPWRAAPQRARACPLARRATRAGTRLEPQQARRRAPRVHDAVAAVQDNLGVGAPYVIFTTGWIGVVRAGSRRRRMCFGLAAWSSSYSSWSPWSHRGTCQKHQHARRRVSGSPIGSSCVCSIAIISIPHHTEKTRSAPREPSLTPL